MDLSIIIVNWHSADYVLACIRSISEETSAVNYEVIVVDNASFDGCGERLAREHPGVIFIQSQCNLGFARANNLGAEQARGAVLLFLNPDTEVRDRAIERLYAYFLELPDPGVVGCRLLNSDGSLQAPCVKSLPTVLNQVLDAEVLRRWFPKAGLWDTAAQYEGRLVPVEVEAIIGACMMIRSTVFRRVGCFSDQYFMYAEDMDLCHKVREAGLKVYYAPGAEVVHHGGGSSQTYFSKFSSAMMHESIYLFLRSNRGRLGAYAYRLSMAASALLRMTILAPGVLLGQGDTCAARRASLHKWSAILRWSAGLGKWMS
jgi:GT2 family glycosyltransferase